MRVFLALLVLAGAAAASPLLHPGRAVERSAVNGGAVAANFTQKLCHFNPNVKDTWNQRYWQNDDFFKAGGPQFLNLGINDEATPDVISNPNSPLVTWGKKLNARLFNLETRFFGQSRPTADLSNDNLKFLNGRQAVEDVTDFINSKNAELGISGPWILFGSAYGGNLVLWHRQLHPDLTVGGHASSAPIEPVFDFFDLTQGVEAAYRNYNSTCADNILAGFKSLHAHMDNADARDELQAAFNFDPAINTLNLTWQREQNIVHVIIGHFLVPVQFNKVNSPPWNNGSGIAEICAIMNKPAINPVAPIANVVAYLQQTVFHSTSGTVNINYDMVMYLFSLTTWSNFLATRRAQIWQQCSEFGQMPTTGYRSAFGTDVPVNYFYNICQDVFGADFTADYIQGRMQQTKDAFGGASGFNGTNVISVFGSIDPQRPAGLQKANDPSVQVVVIDGTAQGADLLPANDTTDPQSLKDFRDAAFKTIQKWLGNGNKAVQSKKKEEAPIVRQPSGFESTICWNCGKPNNKLDHKKPSPEMEKKFGNRLFGGRHSTGGFTRNDQLKAMLKGKTKKNDAAASYITQPVDHFNSKDTRTFQQLVYTNDAYYTKGGPAFLFISGESQANSEWIEYDDIPIVSWAKQSGAMLYMLEHRFYGDSQPLPSMTVDNLQFLTSEQALEDLAAFIRATNKAKGWSNAKWVTFGGSYAGALSAWFREKYPDLTVGTVGTSGPVQTTVDFYGYMQTVEASLRTYSASCADNAAAAYAKVHELFTTIEGRSTLNDGLDVDPPFTEDSIDAYDSMTFFYSIYEPIMGAVQYSGQSWTGIDDVCAGFNGDTDELGRIQWATDDATPFHDFSDVLDWFVYDSDTRAWFWQTCNEFGYYQSTDIGYNAFGSGVPLNFYLRWCSDAYDKSFTRDKLENNTLATNTFYGGRRNYQATNHIQIYGTVDPWHYLGFNATNGDHGQDVVTVLVEGMSHCQDMQPPSEDEPAGLADARNKIQTMLTKWLK